MSQLASMSTDSIGYSQTMGRIELIFGPMNSGKTTELSRRIRRHRVAALSVQVVTPAIDCRQPSDPTLTRPPNSLLTHDDVIVSGALVAERLSDVIKELVKADVCAFDEAQFFPDIVEVSEMLANQGKIVIVAALSGTHERRPFPAVASLMALADDFVHLKAVCMKCKHDAPFTYRNNKKLDPQQRKNTVVVSNDATLYISTCRQCHYQSRMLDILEQNSNNGSPEASQL